MPKNSLIVLLILTIVILAGVIGFQQGTRDCEKENGPILESRFMPFRGCEIRIGDKWRTKEEIKKDVQDGVKEMQEGARKALDSLLGPSKSSK